MVVGAAAVGILISIPGCDAALPNDESQFVVLAAHHATPVNGEFEAKAEDEPRVFETDTGWTVTLIEPVVTTTGVILRDCYGGSAWLDMYWGSFPEDMTDEDLETLTVAGMTVPPGEYCALHVDYSGYEPPPDDATLREAPPCFPAPANEEIVGSSIFLRGSAERRGEMVQFQFRVTDGIRVSLDLSTLEDGGPLTVLSREAFVRAVTVSKSYDRFFDGVDFANFDQNDVEATLPAVLENETRVSLGDEVAPY
jgi:hypothetical protein